MVKPFVATLTTFVHFLAIWLETLENLAVKYIYLYSDKWVLAKDQSELMPVFW